VGRVDTAIRVDEKQALEEQYGEGISVRRRRKERAGREVFSVERGMHVPLVGHRAGERCVLHRIGVDEAWHERAVVAGEHHVPRVEVAHDHAIRVKARQDRHEGAKHVEHVRVPDAFAIPKGSLGEPTQVESAQYTLHPVADHLLARSRVEELARAFDRCRKARRKGFELSRPGGGGRVEDLERRVLPVAVHASLAAFP
jgi:hypothetical protein